MFTDCFKGIAVPCLSDLLRAGCTVEVQGHKFAPHGKVAPHALATMTGPYACGYNDGTYYVALSCLSHHKVLNRITCIRDYVDPCLYRLLHADAVVDTPAGEQVCLSDDGDLVVWQAGRCKFRRELWDYDVVAQFVTYLGK